MLQSVTAAEMPVAIGTAFEWIVDQTVAMIGLVTADPVLSLGVAIWAAGATIGLFKRLV